jgi:alpha-L-fucosidase
MKSNTTADRNAMSLVATLVLAVTLWQPVIAPAQEIQPNWDSMAEHYDPPQWFLDGKIGVWAHWGIPSAIDENRPNDGSHYGRRMYGPNEGETGKQLEMTQTLADWHTKHYGPPSEFGYEKLVPLFQAEKWDPDALVSFFKENGARFIMPVATHHDNFDMYDSSHPWNAVDMGPKRDTIAQWKKAARKQGLKFGVSTHLYWSPRFFNNARQYQKPGTPQWSLFNMDYDPKNYAQQDSWNEHWYARCWELIDKYDPDMFNNDSPFPDEKRGKSLGVKLFSNYLNRDLVENSGQQTTVLSFKKSTGNKQAFTYNCERGMSGELQPYPWMWATDVSGGWFYRKGSITRMSIPVLIANACDAISKNGIVMLNVALRGDGTLPEDQAAYISGLGDWLKINGEGIYGTRPWKSYGEGPTEIKTARTGENTKPYTPSDVRFTSKGDQLFAFVMAIPSEDIVIKTLASGGLYDHEIASIQLLGSDESIRWARTADALTIKLPSAMPDQPVIGFRISAKR